MKRKVLFLGLLVLVALGGFTLDAYIRFFDKRLHMTFCDVGQGDAIFVRTAGGKNILIDAGPDKSVLTCLSEHMPFWDRKIDLLILTHPHDDHFSGIYYIADRYSIKAFVTEKLINKTTGYEMILEKLLAHQVPMQYVLAGDKFTFPDGLTLTIAGPGKKYLSETSPNGTIGESKEFASLITQVSFGDFDALLTGDSQVSGLKNMHENSFHGIDILQAPHHGSRSGLDKNMMRLLAPKMAIISIGKNNYGHPSKEILHLLKEEQIPVLRTDEKGDIEIVSDGKTFIVK